MDGDKKGSQQSGALTHIRLAPERGNSLLDAAASSVDLNSHNRYKESLETTHAFANELHYG
jgi:hypothetical protein